MFHSPLFGFISLSLSFLSLSLSSSLSLSFNLTFLPEVLRLPQGLKLLVEERQDAEGLGKAARLGQQVELK